MSRVSLAARVRPPADRILRVRRRMLQTPVVRFWHPGTGRTVTVAGVVHAAQAGYYRRLNVILARLEAAGALVFYEWVGSAAETEWSAASRAEHDARDTVMADSQEMSQAVCRYLGWVRQAESLAYAASWRNVDITDLELVQRAGAQAVLDQHEAFEDLFGSKPADQRDVAAGVGAVMLMRLISLDRYQLLAHLADSSVSRAMIDHRNDKVLAGLPSDRDSVVIWGCYHVPGLAAGLRRAGYRRQASAWLDAGEFPPLRASAKAAWGVFTENRRGDPGRADQGSGSAGSSGM
jgi:hypothetical protein